MSNKQVKNPIRVLLIDDDEEEYLITLDSLNEIGFTNYKLDWVGSYDAGKKAILESRHDAYLIDYYLGAQTGLSLVVETIANTEAPMILLTGLGNFELDEEAKRIGVADFIVKHEVQPALLDRIIRYSIERARNLKEIKNLNHSLENRVKERTAQLDQVIAELEAKNKNLQAAEKRIRKALERERELNELKTRFVSMASHEFRTPLATILSSASLIRRYVKSEEQSSRDKHLNRIQDNVEHLNNTLNDFLSLGKLEEGAVNYTPSFFDYTQFLIQVLDDLSVTTKTGQYFINEFKGQPKWINFDPKIIKNVLINLISNAIKYSPPASEIKVVSNFDKHAFVISISDSGIGISTEEKKHIFDRFFRANNASNIPGTGLGLNIVKKYLEMMNGEIHFESEVNQGSTFTITLPPNYK